MTKYYAKRISKTHMLAIAAVFAGLGGYTVLGSFASTPVVSCDKVAAITGSDSNPGTTASPYLTAQKVIDSLSPGQTGCLRTGSYDTGAQLKFNSGGTSNNARKTLTSYPGERATLAGKVIYVPPGSNYVTIDRLNISLVTSNAGPSMQIFGDDVTISNNDITNDHQGESAVIVGEYEGAYAKLVSRTKIIGNKIHDSGKLANGAHDHGIYMAATQDAEITDNLIYGNEGGWGIQLWTHAMNTTITHNVLEDNHNGSITISGASNTMGGPSSNNTISQNIFSNPRNRYNVETYWQSGAVGTNNILTNNCMYGAPLGNFYWSLSGVTHSGTVTADPQYADRANDNYALQAGSGCLATVGYDTAAKIANAAQQALSYRGYGPGYWPDSNWRPFAATSPFNRPVPASPPLAADSATKGNYLGSLGAPLPMTVNNADSTADWLHPYYFAKSTDPLVTLHDTQYVGPNNNVTQIHIPSAAHARSAAAGGGDGHISIVQPDGTVCGAWKYAGTVSGVASASAWGCDNVENGDGSDNFTTTAAWFNNMAGIIRAPEMAAGNINHAMFAIVRCSDGAAVYPAKSGTTARTCSSLGVASGGKSVPMGARLWLNMSETEIDALAVPSWKKTILKGLAEYGAIVGDTGAYGNGGFSFGLMYESGSTYTAMGYPDQMAAFAAAQGFTSQPSYMDLGNVVDWSTKLQVLDPCVSDGTCPGAQGKQGDLNNDNLVNIFDLSILLSNYGKQQSQSTNSKTDLNSDGTINIFDLSIILSKYGT